MYGEFYLPRKVNYECCLSPKHVVVDNLLPQFKIAVAVPPTNDVDVFANDLGFIAIVDDNGELQGFNVAIGGGMGVTHGNKKTYPRLGNIIGFCTPEQGKHVAEKVIIVQRDNGNRVECVSSFFSYTEVGTDSFFLGKPQECPT